MTELRQHLLSLRRVHLAGAYPNDLAADLHLDAMHVDPWRRTWRGLVSGAIAASVALGVFVYRQPALDGAAALGSSVDSLRQLAQSTGLWQSEQAKAGPSNLQFRIAPAPLPFGVPAAAPAHGPAAVAATQESA